MDDSNDLFPAFPQRLALKQNREKPHLL